MGCPHHSPRGSIWRLGWQWGAWGVPALAAGVELPLPPSLIAKLPAAPHTRFVSNVCMTKTSKCSTKRKYPATMPTHGSGGCHEGPALASASCCQKRCLKHTMLWCQNWCRCMCAHITELTALKQPSFLDMAKQALHSALHMDTSDQLTHLLKSSTATYSSFSPLVQPTWTQEWPVGQLLSLWQASTCSPALHLLAEQQHAEPQA